MTHDASEHPTRTDGPSNGSDSYLHRTSGFRDILISLARGKWLIALSAAAVTLGFALYTFFSPPVYEASSSVLVDMKGRAASLPLLELPGTGASNRLTNELETLRSRTVAEGVARKLIDRVYVDDERHQPIQIVRDAEHAQEEAARSSLEPILKRLAKTVDFAPVHDSDILRITARSSDPREAALIANTYMQVYTERNLTATRLKSRAIREFLQTQLGAKHLQLDTTEAALQSYMRRSGVVSLDDEAKKLVDQLAQLEASRDAIDLDISTRQNTLASLKQELAVQEPKAARAMGESNDAYIRLTQEQLAKLEVQRDIALAQNQTQGGGSRLDSEQLKETDRQIASLRKNLQERTTAFISVLLPSDSRGGPTGLEGSSSFLAQLKQRIIEQQIELNGQNARKAALVNVLRDYEKQFNQIPEKSIELAKLQRARLSSEKLYLLVEEKFNEAAITETSEFGYLNVLDAAAIPIEPVSPRPVQNLLIGLLLGTLAGAGLVLLRARGDDTIRTPEDLRRHGLRPLTTVIRMDEHNSQGASGNGSNHTAQTLDPHLASAGDPFSPMAEAYRHLRTKVMSSANGSPVHSIMVSSASPGEGKSTTVANLAIARARADQKVLLIDADVRRPSIHALFGLVREPGLTELLCGQASLEAAIRERVMQNMDVLPCGKAIPGPPELLGSRRLSEVLEKIRSRYDLILFDAPPLLAATDPADLARQVDGIVLVASAGSTTVDELDRAVESLEEVSGKILGVVLNNFDLRKAYGGYSRRFRNGYGYGYGYGYAKEKAPAPPQKEQTP